MHHMIRLMLLFISLSHVIASEVTWKPRSLIFKILCLYLIEAENFMYDK
jgi:hypothetical protein